VLWSGDHIFEGVVDTLDMLRSKGKRIIFVTNNSTKSRPDYVKKLASLGIPSTPDEIVGSAYSSALYISQLKLQPPKNKVFVVGESGIEAELSSENIPFIGASDPALRRDITPEDYARMADGSMLDPEVGIVLFGLDFHINYLKLALAFQYCQHGAQFLATNTDATLPAMQSLFPGAGSVMKPLVNMTGIDPVSLGKPSLAMMDAIVKKFDFDRSKMCMIGDRLDTDIPFGINGGLGGTLAVLTGICKKEDWEAENPPAVPAYYAETISDLRGTNGDSKN
jgi:4-nitrophenyl phosphatase